MRRASLCNLLLIGFLTVCVIFPLSSQADEGPVVQDQPTGITTDEILKRMAQQETTFKKARAGYAYRQEIKVQTLDGDTPDGEYRQVFDSSFDDQGKRIKNVIFAPQDTLRRISMGPSDMYEIEDGYQFTLGVDEITQYNLLYVGQQQEDELHCYVFDVAPKEIVGKNRYFQGRIWVDDHDFQIVKSRGKFVPEKRVNKKGKGNEDLHPIFTTWREQIDGKYWFPTYTSTDDTLHFANEDVRIRQVIKYTNYQQFGSKTKITFEGKEVENSKDKSGSQDKPKQ
ncbi:MAG TPA: hypothetical protein VLK33_17865 [Terriglobales bacterium]|nr:hypothetical protein [Terriglobales bacterium]